MDLSAFFNPPRSATSRGFQLGTLAALLLTAFWIPTLFAQTIGTSGLAPEQAIQEGLRRQEERVRAQQRAQEPRSDELSPDAARPAAAEFPQEQQCFVINEVVLVGQDSQRFSWLADAAQPYLRRCIGVKGLSFIAARMDERLRDRGYATTRVDLPPQNLQTGKFLVHVEASRVAAIRMVRADETPDAPDQRWGTWRNAFAVSAGDILDVRDLEQGVENMKRLPSQSVTTRLEPGDQPNTSIVYVERKGGAFRDRVRGGLTLDNFGSSALGRTQLSANLALDNPTGLNDIVSASFNTNAERLSGTHHSQGTSVHYSVPWGYNLLSLNASNSRFAQYVQGTTVRFLSSGKSQSAEARLQRTVWRNASAKLGVYGALSTRRAVSYLDDVEILVQRRRTTNVETGVSYKHLFAQSSMDVEIGYRRGTPWRGAQDDMATAADGGLTLRPHIWTLNASYTNDFKLAGRGLQYSANLRGQRTRNTTLSIDQIAIGGRSSVRGFDGNAVLLAESGIVLRNELTTPLQPWAGVDSVALLGVDFGRVWGPSQALPHGNRLVGMAIGLRGRRGSLQFETTLAMPLYRPTGFRSQGLNLHATLTHSF